MFARSKLSSRASFFLSCLFVVLSAALGKANQDSTAPLVLPPSNVWDGNDGPWSSFALQIGSPPQLVRVLPSTTSNSVWVVIEDGCDDSDGKDCPNSRGNLFAMNASSTWQKKGTYSLPLSPQHYLPYSGNAYYGLDKITLDWPNRTDVTLDNQVILGYADSDFHIGSLGLSAEVFNIASIYDSHSSLLGTMYKESLIPSRSYGYLAGADYYSWPKSSFGSLVFGGIDLTRLNDNVNLTLAGGSDQYRSMLLQIDSITSGDNQLLSEPTIAAIDSRVSQIWLPLSACRAFEDAFDLVWNSTYELYLLDDLQHADLLERNPSVTFALSTGLDTSSDRLNITLPYGAFDKIVTAPFAGSGDVRYFPLKRAANETQVTLGRTFLQEVYVWADYERATVILYPGVYPDTGVASDILTVCPPGLPDCQASTPDGSDGLTRGEIASIVVSTIAFFVILVVSIVVLRRRRKRFLPSKRSQITTSTATGDTTELGDTKASETTASYSSPPESAALDIGRMDSPDSRRSEGPVVHLIKGTVPQEIGGAPRHELPSWGADKSEGDFSSSRQQELPAGNTISELDSSTVSEQRSPSR